MDHNGKLLYGRNERRLFTPASNAKLVVTAVAAALLPPDFTVRTSLYAAGPVVAGVLRGDLVLYGRGDPTFSRRCYATDTLIAGVCDRDPFARLRLMADTLKARGIRQVDGDLVGDGSYFEAASLHPGWELFDLNWWYAAPVSALAFNDNSLDFVWQPGVAVGAPALISMWPDLGDVAFENRTVTVPAGGETDIGDRFFRQPGTAQVWAEGTVALDRPPQDRVVRGGRPQPLRRPRAPAGARRCGNRGHRHHPLDDRLRLLRRGPRPGAAGGDASPVRVRDWIFPILNTSQNLFAEMLLKQLGKRFGARRLVEGGTRGGAAVPDRLGGDRLHRVPSVGRLRPLQREPDDRRTRSPGCCATSGRTRAPRPSRRACPRPAASGTCETRFLGTPLAGRVRAKTGSIAGVNTLSGYIERPDGKPLAFSIEVNHHAQPTRAVLAAIDSVVVEIGKGR